MGLISANRLLISVDVQYPQRRNATPTNQTTQCLESIAARPFIDDEKADDQCQCSLDKVDTVRAVR